VLAAKKSALNENVRKKTRASSLTRTWSVYVIFLFMLPGLLHYLIFRVGPSMATVILSFTNITGVPGVAWDFVGLDNYREFFFLQNTRDLQRALSRTVTYSLSVTLIQNILALFMAIVVNNKFMKGRNFFRAVYFMPVILGVTIVTSVWMLLASVDGPIFALMQALMDNPQPMFANRTLAFPGVIGIQIWMFMGFSMVLYLAGMQNIPSELYEAAFVDGCGEFRSIRYITFPMLWPIITVNVLLAIIGSLQSFDIIFTTTGGQFNTTTLGMMVFATAFGGAGATPGGGGIASLRQGYAASMSMILFIGVFVVTIISQILMKKLGGGDN